MNEAWPYVPHVLAGAKLTIILSVASLILSCIFGFISAAARLSDVYLLQRVSQVYVSVIRGIPELVLMLLVYFGGQMLLNDLGELTGLWSYIDVDALSSAIFSIGFIFCAYMA